MAKFFLLALFLGLLLVLDTSAQAQQSSTPGFYDSLGGFVPDLRAETPSMDAIAPSYAAGTPGLTGMPPGLTTSVPGLLNAPAPAPAASAPPMVSSTTGLPARIPAGLQPVPRFTPDFLNGAFGNNPSLGGRIRASTVLTGIMEDTVSSKSSKSGDLFAIRLEQGYVDQSGNELIPRGSKIVGTVAAAFPAKMSHSGEAGRISVSLQTLVLPDGSTTPFWGFIDHNPTVDLASQGGTPPISKGVSDLGIAALRGTLGYASRTIGYHVAMPAYGPDCKLEKGEAIPIRISRTLDLSHVTPPVNVAGAPPNSVPPGGLQSDPNALMMTPPAVQQGAPVINVPGMSASGMVAGNDPNAIFNQPMQAQPQLELPDPF